MTNPLNTSSNSENLNLERLNAALNRYCLFLTQSVWDSEDLVQDTWLKTLAYMNDRQHSNPEALLLRTAKNAWIDQVRRKKLWERIWVQEKERARTEEKNGTDMNIFLIETILQFLMVRLSPIQRTVLLMRSALGYSVTETADKLNTTPGAVKAAYHRARKVLQDVEYEDIVETPIPEDFESGNLNAISEAYLDGNVDVMIQLVHGDLEVLNVMETFQPVTNHLLSSSYTLYDQPMLRMSA